jgi:two-component system, chemotaxis family, response regulator WspF
VRIAIANDMLIAVEVLRRVISQVPNYHVVWVAYDGQEAVEKCAADTPDLILMDVVMPGMDGVEATRQIMAESPCAILMVTVSVHRYAAKVFEAMGYGAIDAINTPTLVDGQHIDRNDGLLKKIDTIATLIGKSPRRRLLSDASPQHEVNHKIPLVAIGASTGGPQALVKILQEFPQNLPASVVIVQHLDAEFAPGFAIWLDEQVPLPVQLVYPGVRPQPGQIFVAGTNDHLIMTAKQTLNYNPEPLNCLYRPSIDVFFESVAQYWQGQGIGVLLTGMGRDGAQGLKKLQARGWHTIAQDRNTSVVYGMPKAAVELKAAGEVLPIEAIASACQRILGT